MRVVTDGEGRWQAYVESDLVGTVRTRVRPDRRCYIWFDDCDSAAYRPLLAAATAAFPQALYAVIDETEAAKRDRLEALGFQPQRREHRYRFDLSAWVPPVPTLAGISLISAAEADLDRLRRLDEDLRQEIPGSDGWCWGEAEFREETFSDGFDPGTYLVAVARAGGDHIGLVRVWLRPEQARLGCLGVRPAYRGTRVTAALLGRAFAAARQRGVTALTAEIDETNRASARVAAKLGATRIGGLLHLVRTPAGGEVRDG